VEAPRPQPVPVAAAPIRSPRRCAPSCSRSRSAPMPRSIPEGGPQGRRQAKLEQLVTKLKDVNFDAITITVTPTASARRGEPAAVAAAAPNAVEAIPLEPRIDATRSRHGPRKTSPWPTTRRSGTRAHRRVEVVTPAAQLITKKPEPQKGRSRGFFILRPVLRQPDDEIPALWMPTTSSRTIVSASRRHPHHAGQADGDGRSEEHDVADERQRHVADPILLIELALAPWYGCGPRRGTRGRRSDEGEQHAPSHAAQRAARASGRTHQWRGEEDDDRLTTRARRRGRAAIVSG